MSAHILVPEWELFLSQLGKVPNVAAACRAAGIGRGAVDSRRKRDPEFAKRWEDAIEDAIEGAEEEAFIRGTSGYLELQTHNGKPIMVTTIEGHPPQPLFKRIVSDRMLEFQLKALRPEKYRERTQMQMDAHVASSTLTRAEKDTLIAAIVERASQRVQKAEDDLG